MKNKNIITIALVAAICIMSIGYAALTQQMIVNTGSKVTGVWDISIQNLYTASTTGTATVLDLANTELSASFEVELLQPGDKAIIAIPIKNNGNIPAKLKKLTITEEGTDAISYTVSGLNENDDLAAGATAEIRIEAYYVSASSTTADSNYKTINVNLNFTQQ